MRYTRRERVLGVLAGALAITVAALLGLALLRASPHRATTATGVAARGTTSAPATSRPGTLKADYAVRGRWPGGFTAEVVVTNLGSEPVEGWTVRLRLPPGMTVGDVWSADAARAPGAVVLRSQPWDTYLAPGATVHVGFEATGSPVTPESCTVNGSPC
jgi:cellulase/cellobiase CelA1